MDKINVITKLKNDYITVDSSFGGDQTWFENIERKWKGKAIKGYGCGLIGAADVLLYTLGKTCVLDDKKDSDSKDSNGKDGNNKDSNSKDVNNKNKNDNVPISMDEYMSYICSLEKRYFHILPKLGLSGILMALGINMYFWLNRKKIKEETGHSYRARWAVRPSKLLDRIKEMLENDIPVIISIGPGFFHKEKVKFYRMEQRDKKVIFKPVTKTKDHYVTVTGLVESAEVTMLEISSWGRRYYVNWNEYKEFVKKNDNYYFSNILYIKSRT